MTEALLELATASQPLALPGVLLGGRPRAWAKAFRRTSSRARWGNLRRTSPFSSCWGFDRGTPVDRIYIERFLAAHAGDVRGRVLEVRDSRYTTAFGRDQVTQAEVVDIDSANPRATIVADLGAPGSLPAEAFECVVVVQTLQYVARPRTAVENLRRGLTPAGIALITVPCTSRIDPDAPAADRWRFTPSGLEALLRSAGDWAELDVSGYGNLITSVAFLMGIAAEELRRPELGERDATFPLVACARARKPA